jgi:hypothetical protein
VTLFDFSKKWQKHQKLADINDFANHPVKQTKLKESGIINLNQNPPAGTVQSSTTNTGKLVQCIVLHVWTENSRAECYKLQPSIWSVLHKPFYDGTVIHMSGYINHLVDPVYTKVEHQKINGLLQES